MPKTKHTKPTCRRNPLIQADRQDTLLNASAVITCLQHMELKIGLEDEAELGINLILETVREAVRYEALEREK